MNADDFNPVEFLKVQLAGQADDGAIRLTTYGGDVTWNGKTWYALSWSHSQTEEQMASSAGEVPAVTVTVTNVDRQMGNLISTCEVEGAEATLWRTDRQLLANPRDALELTRGEVRDIQLNDTVLTFQIVSILGQMELINVPRRCFQANCNYVFGTSPHCGVNINVSPLMIEFDIVEGSTKDYIVLPDDVLSAAGDPADPNQFWDPGYISLLSGPAGLQARTIQRIEQLGSVHRAYLRPGFLTDPQVGDSAVIRVTCARDKAHCQRFQGNVLQFGGFVEAPPVRFNPIVKRYSALDP